MNTSGINRIDAPAESRGERDHAACAGTRPASPRKFGRIGSFLFLAFVRALRGERRPPSVLRNNTNLPVFLALALGLSLVCNFALRESSAQASRAMGPVATLHEALNLLAEDPQNPVLHSRLGELYMRERNYRRAMFHLREAGRLAEVYGE